MASQKRSINLSDEAVGFAEQYSRDIGATEVRWSGAVPEVDTLTGDLFA